MEKFDFSGWATRNDLKCADGRVITKDAFKDNDGDVVPLVWMHQHKDPSNVLGHAVLENREDGVYTYCFFNDSEKGALARELVKHGDVTSLSIYANQLKHSGSNVLHGVIKEVSLVLAGANPGAYIDEVMSHSSDGSELDEYEATMYFDQNICLNHAEEKKQEEKKPEENKDEKTIGDILETFNEEQLTVLSAITGDVLANENKESKGGSEMKHNLFESDTKGNETDILTHADMDEILKDAKRIGSLRDSVLQHTQTYGIENIDYLFPEATNVNTPPGFIKRKDDWVSNFMSAVHKSPFSRIKSMFADITADDARAKGYLKGNLKTEEVFSLLKRSTTPTTIYKKQKLDRDDIIDIVDFDVVAWLRTEMRVMLDEEIARACLIGDGRLGSSDDKINEANIRPIWTDADLYTVKQIITLPSSATDDDKAKQFIRAAIKCRKNYKGSGNPTMYTTEDYVTDCLLLEDTTGRKLYANIGELCTTLRVKEIVTVPVMENLTRTSGGDTLNLMGILINPQDYNIGADKGGEINMFDDFDIDYNQNKYLIETRCSGALTVPYSAVAIEWKMASNPAPVEETPAEEG